MKAHIRVTVAVLDAHNSVANHCHARPVTEKFLECRLGVELFRLDELVVKVEVVQPAFLEWPSVAQALITSPIASHDAFRLPLGIPLRTEASSTTFTCVSRLYNSGCITYNRK